MDFSSLDNPVWFALNSGHEALARRSGLARRYPGDVSPLAGIAKPTAAAFSDLANLLAIDEHIALVNADPLDLPAGWQVARTSPLEQMVCTEMTKPASVLPIQLGPADVPEMLALTAATEPGPFLPLTIRMGRYFGIRSEDGRLAAMAGERLKPDGFTEISAVCTDPEFRGRGYGRRLVSSLAGMIMAESRIPFLHVLPENNGAKSVYEKVGFRLRHTMCLAVIGRAHS